MGAMDHDRWAERIDEHAEGRLGDREAAELETHLAGCAACRADLAASRRTLERLEASRIEVRPGFAREVMAALEPAPWEARAPRAWRLPFALLAVLGVAAAALLGAGATSIAPESGVAAAFVALADVLRAAFLAGGGLAAASWRGLGGAVAEWLGPSAPNWIAASVLVLGANYLLWRLLRARRGEATERSGRRR